MEGGWEGGRGHCCRWCTWSLQTLAEHSHILTVLAVMLLHAIVSTVRQSGLGALTANVVQIDLSSSATKESTRESNGVYEQREGGKTFHSCHILR